MALTKEDLQAIGALIDSKLEPTNARLDSTNARLDTMQADVDRVHVQLETMQADVDQIKEDTAITREAVNTLGDWVEVASDVLKIGYPIERIE